MRPQVHVKHIYSVWYQQTRRKATEIKEWFGAKSRYNRQPRWEDVSPLDNFVSAALQACVQTAPRGARDAWCPRSQAYAKPNKHCALELIFHVQKILCESWVEVSLVGTLGPSKRCLIFYVRTLLLLLYTVQYLIRTYMAQGRSSCVPRSYVDAPSLSKCAPLSCTDARGRPMALVIFDLSLAIFEHYEALSSDAAPKHHHCHVAIALQLGSVCS